MHTTGGKMYKATTVRVTFLEPAAKPSVAFSNLAARGSASSFIEFEIHCVIIAILRDLYCN